MNLAWLVAGSLRTERARERKGEEEERGEEGASLLPSSPPSLSSLLSLFPSSERPQLPDGHAPDGLRLHAHPSAPCGLPNSSAFPCFHLLFSSALSRAPEAASLSVFIASCPKLPKLLSLNALRGHEEAAVHAGADQDHARDQCAGHVRRRRSRSRAVLSSVSSGRLWRHLRVALRAAFCPLKDEESFVDDMPGAFLRAYGGGGGNVAAGWTLGASFLRGASCCAACPLDAISHNLAHSHTQSHTQSHRISHNLTESHTHKGCSHGRSVVLLRACFGFLRTCGVNGPRNGPRTDFRSRRLTPGSPEYRGADSPSLQAKPRGPQLSLLELASAPRMG